MDLPITQHQLDRWQAGELIQHVMPELTAEQREFLISGLPPTQQDRLFTGENTRFKMQPDQST